MRALDSMTIRGFVRAHRRSIPGQKEILGGPDGFAGGSERVWIHSRAETLGR